MDSKVRKKWDGREEFYFFLHREARSRLIRRLFSTWRLETSFSDWFQQIGVSLPHPHEHAMEYALAIYPPIIGDIAAEYGFSPDVVIIMNWFTKKNHHEQVDSALQWALEHWDIEHARAVTANAKEYGSRGGRPKAYSLEGHLQTAHLNVTAASKTLGISPPTVRKMRREYADINLEIGESHEAALDVQAEPTRVRDNPRTVAGHPHYGLDESYEGRSQGENSSSPNPSGMRTEYGLAYSGDLPY